MASTDVLPRPFPAFASRPNTLRSTTSTPSFRSKRSAPPTMMGPAFHKATRRKSLAILTSLVGGESRARKRSTNGGVCDDPTSTRSRGLPAEAGVEDRGERGQPGDAVPKPPMPPPLPATRPLQASAAENTEVPSTPPKRAKTHITPLENASARRAPSKSQRIFRNLTTRFRKSTPPRSPPPPSGNQAQPPDDAAKRRREAALRERGLLAPLERKDLSQLEREQDKYIRPLVPGEDRDAAEGSAADKIKREWERRNQESMLVSRGETAHEGPRSADLGGLSADAQQGSETPIDPVRSSSSSAAFKPEDPASLSSSSDPYDGEGTKFRQGLPKFGAGVGAEADDACSPPFDPYEQHSELARRDSDHESPRPPMSPLDHLSFSFSAAAAEHRRSEEAASSLRSEARVITSSPSPPPSASELRIDLPSPAAMDSQLLMPLPSPRSPVPLTPAVTLNLTRQRSQTVYTTATAASTSTASGSSNGGGDQDGASWADGSLTNTLVTSSAPAEDSKDSKAFDDEDMGKKIPVIVEVPGSEDEAASIKSGATTPIGPPVPPPMPPPPHPPHTHRGMGSRRRRKEPPSALSLTNLRRSVVGTLSRGRDAPASATLSKTSEFGVRKRPSVSSRTASGRSVSQPVSNRQAVAPRMHSRGSILMETAAIEDDETRRMTEMAFLG